jgi:hypothetical protein
LGRRFGLLLSVVIFIPWATDRPHFVSVMPRRMKPPRHIPKDGAARSQITMPAATRAPAGEKLEKEDGG